MPKLVSMKMLNLDIRIGMTYETYPKKKKSKSEPKKPDYLMSS